MVCIVSLTDDSHLLSAFYPLECFYRDNGSKKFLTIYVSDIRTERLANFRTLLIYKNNILDILLFGIIWICKCTVYFTKHNDSNVFNSKM